MYYMRNVFKILFIRFSIIKKLQFVVYKLSINCQTLFFVLYTKKQTTNMKQ